MSVTAPTPESPSDSPPATLGEVLNYSIDAGAGTSEAHWERLVRAVGEREQSAFAELYVRAHRLVFTLVMRIVRSRETAEELTLDVFHDIWRRAASYDPRGGTVLGWIMNQARSRAIDRIRHDTRKKRVDPLPPSQEASATELTSEEVLQVRQREEQLRRALTVLTADERRAIETAFFGECTYAEAAVRLCQPAGTIKTRIRSGLVKLRTALGEGENSR